MRRAAAVLAVVVVTATTGCGVNGLRITQGHQFGIAFPRAGGRVSLPITLRLRSRGLDLAPPGSGHGHYFALFVDRAPLKPGESLLALVDETCRRSGHGCANLKYFAEHEVYLTASTTFRLDAVPQLTTRRPTRTVHQVDVVLMNADDRREGESVAITTFRVSA